jgi:hypothetical protein
MQVQAWCPEEAGGLRGSRDNLAVMLRGQALSVGCLGLSQAYAVTTGVAQVGRLGNVTARRHRDWTWELASGRWSAGLELKRKH